MVADIPGKSLKYRETFGSRSRDVAGRSRLAQAGLLKLEKEEEPVLAAPWIRVTSTFTKTRHVKWTTDVEAVTVLIETRILFTRDPRKLLQIVESVQILVTEKLKRGSVKVVTA